MQIKFASHRTTHNLFIYIALLALSLFLIIKPVTLFSGITLSLATVTMLIIICMYGLKLSILAAIIVYGLALYAGAINYEMALIHFVAITFISLRMRKNPNSLIHHTMLFWLLIGGPVLFLLLKSSGASIDHFVTFSVLREITTALLSSLIVDILFLYDPFKRKNVAAENTPIGFRFSHIMLHLTLVAISTPYFIYVGITSFNSSKDIVHIAEKKFVSQLQTIENYLYSQTDSHIFALKQNGILQTSLLNQQLYSVSSDTDTEIVITDYNNIPLGTNMDIPKEQPFIWSLGGSDIHEFEITLSL